MSNTVIEDLEAGSSTASNLDPVVYQEYALLAEMTLLNKQQLDGIYVIPKAMTPFEWFGIIFLRQGPYRGGIFRFTLSLPETFPDTNVLPGITFEQEIYHPLIDPKTQTFDLDRYFKEGWKSGIHHIYHSLIFLQRGFYSFNSDYSTAPNQEAVRMIQNSPQLFKEKAAESVRRSRELVYEEPLSSDPHAIRFSPWNQSVHERQRVKLLRYSSGHQQQTKSGNESSRFSNGEDNNSYFGQPGDPSAAVQVLSELSAAGNHNNSYYNSSSSAGAGARGLSWTEFKDDAIITMSLEQSGQRTTEQEAKTSNIPPNFVINHSS